MQIAERDALKQLKKDLGIEESESAEEGNDEGSGESGGGDDAGDNTNRSSQVDV